MRVIFIIGISDIANIQIVCSFESANIFLSTIFAYVCD